eukprot:gene9457-1700_t
MWRRVGKWMKSWIQPTDTSSTEPKASASTTNTQLSSFVSKRTRFKDADGFYAHEFYIETPCGSSLQQVPKNDLEQEGMVALEKPRLPADSPVLLCDSQYDALKRKHMASLKKSKIDGG